MPNTMKGWAELASDHLKTTYMADFTPQSLRSIDSLFGHLGKDWYKRFWEDPTDAQTSQACGVHALAAYIGEILVRHSGAKWDYDNSGTLLDKARYVELPDGKQIFPIKLIIEKVENFSFADWGSKEIGFDVGQPRKSPPTRFRTII